MYNGKFTLCVKLFIAFSLVLTVHDCLVPRQEFESIGSFLSAKVRNIFGFDTVLHDERNVLGLFLVAITHSFKKHEF